MVVNKQSKFCVTHRINQSVKSNFGEKLKNGSYFFQFSVKKEIKKQNKNKKQKLINIKHFSLLIYNFRIYTQRKTVNSLKIIKHFPFLTNEFFGEILFNGILLRITFCIAQRFSFNFFLY